MVESHLLVNAQPVFLTRAMAFVYEPGSVNESWVQESVMIFEFSFLISNFLTSCLLLANSLLTLAVK